jgi:hypothetical protein
LFKQCLILNNVEVSSVNITLDGTMYPGQKLARFVLREKTTNVNKTHQLIPGIGTAILGVMEPHCSIVIFQQVSIKQHSLEPIPYTSFIISTLIIS